ncbi:MAG: energy transducer TonB [Candidatus Acidiferrales bacterium]
MRQVIFRLSCGATVLNLLALAALSIFIAPSARSQSAKDAATRAQATALFAKALSVTDIRAPGSPPFVLRGTISVQRVYRKAVIGTYLLKWASPTKWREEIAFGDYTRIRVGGENQYWQSRTTPDEVESILQLDQALDFLKRLHAWSNPASIAALKDVRFYHERKKGAKLDCVTLMAKGRPSGPDYCFDSATGTETSDTLGPSHFSDFLSFDGKHFPGSLRADAEPDPPVTLLVNSIAPLSETGGEDFQPPQYSTAWPSCDDPDAVPARKRVVPPEGLARSEGAVFVYGVIGVDGHLTHLAVISSPDEGLARSTLIALSQWEYSPETCHGVPVPVETLECIIYNLAY